MMFFKERDKAYDVRTDEIDANTSYFGESRVPDDGSGAVWWIRKSVTVGTETIIKNANNSTLHNKIWDDRASYTY